MNIVILQYVCYSARTTLRALVATLAALTNSGYHHVSVLGQEGREIARGRRAVATGAMGLGARTNE